MTKKNEVTKQDKGSYASPEVATPAVEVDMTKESNDYPFATFTCELPSQGKIYPKGHQFYAGGDLKIEKGRAKVYDGS